MGQDHFSEEATGLPSLLDDRLIAAPGMADALASGTPVVIDEIINNRNRSVGAMLSNELTKRWGGAGLPDGTIIVNLEGHTGQSFGFTLAKGITMTVSGDANDGCGKGLSGGEIVVAPGDVMDGGVVPEENVVLGNCALYGAT